MRTLEINKTNLWYVSPDGIEVELKDEDGYYTGEIEIQYEEPLPINLHLYPANGKILEESFGLAHDLDYVTSTNTKLDNGMLLFKEKPTRDYSNTYDFKIDGVLESLNFYQYGLKGRR